MARFCWAGIALSLAVLAVSLGYFVAQYDQLPDRVPIHWNLAGQPDGWAAKSKAFGLTLPLPILGVALAALAPLLPRLSPQSFTFDHSRRAFAWGMLLGVALLGYLQLVITWASFSGHPVDPGRPIVAGLLLFIIAIGGFLARVERNWWMGIRTPWTLADDEVWRSTHRLAGWLFAGGGLAGILMLAAGLNPLWCLAPLVVAILTPAAYSLLLYKRRQARGLI